MLEAKIRFFDIKKCGYYKSRRTVPEFGRLPNTLKMLKKWGSGFGEIINTTTYEADPDNDLRSTYFCDMAHHKDSGDFLLILWNEVTNHNGKIYGMKPTASPGDSKMLQSGFTNKKAIPGFPSYFWFIKKQNLVASIKFEHSYQGKSNMEAYLNGFLANKSKYKVVSSDGDIIGYSKKAMPSNDDENIIPRFHALSSKNKELEAELLANVSSITRLIKKETLDYSIPDDRSKIEKLFSGVLPTTPQNAQKRHVTHELQYSPSKDELTDIISIYRDRITSSTSSHKF